MAKKKADPNPPENIELMGQTEEHVLSNPPAEAVAEATVPEATDTAVEPISQETSAEADVEEYAETAEALLLEDAAPRESGAEETPPAPSAGETKETDYSDLLQELGEGGTLPVESGTDTSESDALTADDLLLLSEDGAAASEDLETVPENNSKTNTAPLSPAYAAQRNRVLTIDAKDEIQTEEEREATIWHEIQNAYRTRRILTGTLDAIEKTPSGFLVVAVTYKGFRVVIPLKEMMIQVERLPNGARYADTVAQLDKIINSRVSSEIDFIIKGIINKSRTIVASRKDAMLKKRQTFYMDTDEFGEPMIYEGRVVQARVVAVAEKVIRVEVFGVETPIRAQGLSWEWISDAKEHFSVGDRILVRVLKINRPDVEHITISADVRSVSAATNHDNLKKCVLQSRYAGRVTDVHNGVVYIRLNVGVNAVAHSCYDRRTPGKNDDVSFAVTRIDEEQGVAVGIITRIIKQNL